MSPPQADPHGRGRQVCPVLVGRDDLLALAARRSGAARAGAGHLLFLAGEAGLGKTRLLTEITRSAADGGFTIIRAEAFPHDLEVAGGVLADLAADLRRSPEPVIAEAGIRMTGRLRETGTSDGDAHRRHRMLVTDLAEAIISAGSGPGPLFVALEDLGSSLLRPL